MMITEVLPGIILGFREGLEAFLIIGLIQDYLRKSGQLSMRKYVSFALVSGIVLSVFIGLVLVWVFSLLGADGSVFATFWESGMSFIGLLLLTVFIYWMMKHGKTIGKEIKAEISQNLSKAGLFLLAFVVILREGVEISLFGFSSFQKELYLSGVLGGAAIAGVLAFLIYRSLVKVNLAVVFRITLIYLILQAGYFFGYSVHEFLAALKESQILSGEHILFVKLYNLQNTVFDHKTGILGVPLNILVGWYSRPEILQFVFQHVYVFSLFFIWRRLLRKNKTAKK